MLDLVENKYKLHFCLIFILLIIAPVSSLAEAKNRPNFIIIVADDLGYSDIGRFGGEIETPSLDSLADSGVRLTDFHTAPTCSPTRAMLFTGIDNHLVGLGNMKEVLTEDQKGQPGYEGYLNFSTISLPEVLKENGYETFMVGKWHLGRSAEISPAGRGFDKSFALMQGGASHFDDQRAIIGADPKAIYRDNGKEVELPEGFFSSDFYVDRMIQYLEESDADNPFFAFVSFTAPHWPLQAPVDYIEKYKGRYDEGYEAIQKERHGRMVDLGIVDGAVGPNNSTIEGLPGWSDLSDEERRVEAKKMEIYSAMVDNMDHNIGRLMSHLEASGNLDNTVIVFMSDNGAEGNDPSLLPTNKAWIENEYNNSYENMGHPNSYIWQSPQWAQVSSTPFPMWKSFTSQGGLLAPAIIKILGVTEKGSINDDFLHVKDIMPTFLSLANIENPVNNGEHLQIQGVSMLKSIEGKQRRERVIGWEFLGRAAVRKGDWKIRLLENPYGTGEWELYNLANDPTESMNLASTNKDKLAEMLEEWDRYVEENGVIVAEPGAFGRIGYSMKTCSFGKCLE
ncbi:MULTISPECIES: arylsulfatase [Marinobacter]|uniref:arylsulfatase n=1 Tax=Marinobacter TaxID=2742 RepID=UPI001245E2BF|nr:MULTISPECIES: arylsulfatase [Marinobacter]MBL3556370.1 arylsulfatase [Marinobacter sp. JB05H06]